MAPKDDKLATFRIDSQKWERFKEWAYNNKSSASAVLLNLINRCLAGDISPSSIVPNTNLDNLDSLIDERIEAKLQSLSQTQPDNLDTILNEHERYLESHLLSIIETMLETKLEELQGNITRIESDINNRIEKLSQVQSPVGLEALASEEKVEVDMQQEQGQLQAMVEELQTENEALKQQNQELQQQLSNVVAPLVPQPDYEAVRDRVLKSLTSGKGKVASTSPQFKTAAKALDRFILELRESTQVSTPVSTHDSETSPDGTAALGVK